MTLLEFLRKRRSLAPESPLRARGGPSLEDFARDYPTFFGVQTFACALGAAPERENPGKIRAQKALSLVVVFFQFFRGREGGRGASQLVGVRRGNDVSQLWGWV